MELAYDFYQMVWTSLVAYSTIQGFILFILFLRHPYGSRQVRRLLAWCSLLCAILLSEELLKRTVGFETLPHVLYADSPIWFLLAPSLYLYVRQNCNGQFVNARDWVHLIPAWVVGVDMIEFYLQPAAYKMEFLNAMSNGYTHPLQYFNFSLFSAQSVFYFLRSGWLLKSTTENDSRIKQKKYLSILIGVLGLVTAISFLSVILLKSGFIISWSGYLDVLLLSGFLLLLFVKSVWGPRELFLTIKPASTLGLSSNLMNNSFERLLQFMDEHAPYRDPQYDIQTMAHQLGYSKNYLTQLIRNHAALGFKEFLNHYRVKEAKEKLRSPLSSQFTIQSIADDVGFTSQATFYRAFKKIEGTTPKVFTRHGLLPGNHPHQNRV